MGDCLVAHLFFVSLFPWGKFSGVVESWIGLVRGKLIVIAVDVYGRGNDGLWYLELDVSEL